MNLVFRPLTKPDPAFFTKLAEWYRDPAIKYAIRPNFEAREMADMTAEQLAEGYGRNPNKLVFVICAENQMIGEVTLDRNFPKLSLPDVPSAWISILIGEKAWWGCGAGTRAMNFLEDTSRKLGLHRIELGVFAFNEPAIRLYRRMGYQEIARIEHFTYRPDQWYADIRMEKWL